jgi:hypothetical protein
VQRLAVLADDLFLPTHELDAEVDSLTLVHERLALGRPITLWQYYGALSRAAPARDIRHLLLGCSRRPSAAVQGGFRAELADRLPGRFDDLLDRLFAIGFAHKRFPRLLICLFSALRAGPRGLRARI